MGAYSYCQNDRCNAPQNAPELEEFTYGDPTCDYCGAVRPLREEVYREVVAARIGSQDEKIALLEAAVLELTSRNKDDGK